MRKTFNVTDKDAYILHHLAKQVNMSQYIISLIKQDMGKRRIVTEDQIIEIVKQYMSSFQLTSKPNMDSFPMESVLKILD